jgi:putative tryptophan/tyrosine transport system substrate-binding protein
LIGRRTFIVASAAAVLGTPFLALAQQRVYRIGYLANDPDPRKDSRTFRAFVDALREAGWSEGQNIEIVIRSSAGRDEMFPKFAGELVRDKVDVIVATGSPSTRAAKEATDSIPIVFGSAANPVEQNFVASLARPGGNVTGLAILVQELGPKRMAMLKEILPRSKRFARLFSRTSIVRLQPKIMEEYDTGAKALGITVQHVSVAGPNEIESTFAAIAVGGVDGIVADPAFVVNRAKVAALALNQRIPLIGPDGRFAEAGALASYGENFPSRYRQAGFLVDKILRGAKPADLPVQISSTFETAINLKTAKALGLTVPSSILVQANLVYN